MKNEFCVCICVSLRSDHLMDLTLGFDLMCSHWFWSSKCVSLQAHGGSSYLPLPFAARRLSSHPTLSHEALFKYFSPECPGLRPIYFIWWGALRTDWPCEKHTKSSAASPASSPRHLLSPHIPCLKSVFYTSLFLDRSQDGRKNILFYNGWYFLHLKEQWTIFLLFICLALPFLVSAFAFNLKLLFK